MNTIKNRFRAVAKRLENKEPLSDGAKGALIGHLNRECGGDDYRRMVLYAWFRQEDGEIRQLSSSQLTEAEWNAIQEVASPFKVELEWTVSAQFCVDIQETMTNILGLCQPHSTKVECLSVSSAAIGE